MNKIQIKNFFLAMINFNLCKRFISIWGQDCTILVFHRVIRDELIPLEKGPNRSLSVSVSFFESLIKYLQKEYTIISMDNINQILLKKTNKKYICITFDDGYADNYSNVLPIIKNYQVPATFYITNDFIDGIGNVWWYEIWEILTKSKLLEFTFNGSKYTYKINTENSRLLVYKKIRKLLMNQKFSDINLLLEKISKNKKPKPFSEKFMNWDQVYEIDSHPLFTIGCHTISHPILKNEKYHNAKFQIEQSKKILENKLNHKINHLAFPFGGKNEVNLREFRIAKELGFETAVTTYCVPENKSTIFCLPRLSITDHYGLKGIEIRINGLSNFLGKQFG